MAGQSVLASAALVTQSVANVETLAGPKPLSIFAQTIGESGDGKTTSEDAAQHAIRERQRQEARAYREQLAAWECEPRKGRGDPPREPYRVMGDATVEGIRQAFLQGRASQGAFTSEAAAILSGYGMTPEHRAKTAATLNSLWDSGEISVARSGAGRFSSTTAG